MVRTFVAATVPDDVKDALFRAVRTLKNAAPRIRWTRPDSWHVTMKFLGDVPEPDLQPLFDAVAAVAGEAEPFVADVTGLGAFPHWRQPRTVWAGMGEGGDELTALGRSVQAVCGELGYPPDSKPFTPHITLGRIQLPGDAGGVSEAAATLADEPFGVMEVEEVVVYMSDLRRTGAVYAPMFRAKLGRS